MGPVKVTGSYQEVLACDLPAINTGNIFLFSHCAPNDGEVKNELLHPKKIKLPIRFATIAAMSCPQMREGSLSPREDTCIYLPAEQVESLSSAINLYNRGLCGGIIQVILERDKKEGYLTRPANPVQNF
jgi:hypothetical protein